MTVKLSYIVSKVWYCPEREKESEHMASHIIHVTQQDKRIDTTISGI
jgi:hypothetical protein